MRFLFDVHVHHGACLELQRRGVDVVHAADVGLDELDDLAVLESAIAEGRILVTRNYRDFAVLVEALSRRGREFPGVLFVPRSIGQIDPAAHVCALEAWIAGYPPGENPVANAYGFL